MNEIELLLAYPVGSVWRTDIGTTIIVVGYLQPDRLAVRSIKRAAPYHIHYTALRKEVTPK